MKENTLAVVYPSVLQRSSLITNTRSLDSADVSENYYAIVKLYVWFVCLSVLPP